MEKDFIETCKLLKKHYRRLIQPDANTQSNDEFYEPNIAHEIISEAKELLFYEQLYALSDKDIENLRQNSVVKYAKTLENFISPKNSTQGHTNCSKNHVQWKDDILEYNTKEYILNPKSSTKTENNAGKQYFHNEKDYSNSLKLLEKEKNDKQIRKCISNILDVNIDENIDQILKKYNLGQDDVNFQNKIKEDLLKEHEQLTEILKKKYNISDISKIDEENELSEICEVIEESGEDKDTQKSDETVQEIEEHEDKKDMIGINEKLQNNSDISVLDMTVTKCNIPLSNKDNVDHEYVKKENEKFEIKILKDDIPELSIVPQSTSNIKDFLEVSKMTLIGEDSEKKVTSKCKNIKSEESIIPTKKIETFLENFKEFKAMSRKAKSDIEKSKTYKPIVKTKPKSSCFENKIASFENRFKAQQNIILAQKAKLAEQERLIQDLKLKKIKELAAESFKETREEIRKSVPSLIKQKPIAKVEEKSDSEENNSLSISLNLSKAPKIMQCMEERARERQERRLLIKERKRLMEEEKKRLVEEAIQRKMKEEAEEKQQRLENLKEQRRIARELELKRQLEKKHFIEINQKAYAHYKKKLIKTCFNKIKMMIVNIRIQEEIAIRFYDNFVVIKQFKKWRQFTENEINDRTNIADNFYRKTLLQKCFEVLKSIYYKRRQNMQVAQDRYDMSLQAKYFKAWLELVCQLYIQNKINFSKAEKKYSRNLMFQCFLSWRKLPSIMEIERIQNERKLAWRLRVAEILPDYNPLQNPID